MAVVGSFSAQDRDSPRVQPCRPSAASYRPTQSSQTRHSLAAHDPGAILGLRARRATAIRRVDSSDSFEVDRKMPARRDRFAACGRVARIPRHTAKDCRATSGCQIEPCASRKASAKPLCKHRGVQGRRPILASPVSQLKGSPLSELTNCRWDRWPSHGAFPPTYSRAGTDQSRPRPGRHFPHNSARTTSARCGC
jgi:hypothetical protein